MTLITDSPVSSSVSISQPHLVADIGGTNARFALSDPTTGALQHVLNLPCAGRPTLTELVTEYLATKTGPGPTRLCVALAGPIQGDLCRLTNTPLEFSIEGTRQALGLETLDVINDFEAIAAGVPTFGNSDLDIIGTALPRPDQPKAVIGPGTGLGMAGLVHTPSGWLVIPGEGGHIPAAPRDDLESDLINVLRRTHGYVSAETICSGPGLIRTYTALCRLHGIAPKNLTAAQITERGTHDTDLLCAATLTVFVNQLAAVATTAALAFGARGGVYLAGGIPAHIADLLHTGNFRDQFQTHPQMGHYLAPIATVRIAEPNPGLRGAGTWLRARPAG